MASHFEKTKLTMNWEAQWTFKALSTKMYPITEKDPTLYNQCMENDPSLWEMYQN